MRKFRIRAGIPIALVWCFLGASPLYASGLPEKSGEIDSAEWKQRVYEELELITELTIPIRDEALIAPPLPETTPLTFEGRLRKIENQVPLTWNSHVESYVVQYNSDRYRDYFSRMLGLGTYYFALFDRIFEETGLPKEIKYLSVVESALDPHAVSRMGATGPWQFMFATARMYGLEMNRDLDERKDPVAATYAASRYLLEAHEQFGDWLLAIAAYNCGPGNVLKAIRRSGIENPDYWQIRRFLPRETQNYIPKFIALTYMFEYHEEYGLTPHDNDLNILTEMVNVQQNVSMDSIAQVIEIEKDFLQKLNPAYKHDVIKGTSERPRRLVLPVVDPQYYAELYAVLNEPNRGIEPRESMHASISHHTVKKGDTLSGIAKKYPGVSVSSIRTANGLKSDRINPGMKLEIR